MFWGGKSQQQQQTRPVTTAPDIKLSVPMPPLTAEVFSETAASEAAQMTTPSAPESHSSPEPQAEEDDTFILKQLPKTKKRKHTDPAPPAPDTDALATQTDEVTIDPSADRARLKAERKRAKKEAKAFASAAAADAEAEDEAFDYASAPSILNPPRKSIQELKAERKKVKDPYSKSLDAPKGQPRVQKERAGRSMTFKK